MTPLAFAPARRAAADKRADLQNIFDNLTIVLR